MPLVCSPDARGRRDRPHLPGMLLCLSPPTHEPAQRAPPHRSAVPLPLHQLSGLAAPSMLSMPWALRQHRSGAPYGTTAGSGTTRPATVVREVGCLLFSPMIVFVVQWARSTIIIVVQWTRGKLTRAQAALRAILPLAPLASIAAAALPAPPVPAGLHHAVSLPPASPSPPASPPTAAAVASVVAAPPRAAAAAASRSAALGAFETAHAFSPSLLSLPTDMKRSTAPPLTRQRGCGHSSVQRPSSVPARSPTNLVWIEPP